MDNRIYWIWLSAIKGIGIRKLSILLKEYGNLENLWNLDKSKIKTIKNIGENVIFRLLNNEYKIKAYKYLEYMIKNKIDIISIQDVKYPKQLKDIYDPPIAIYVQGNVNIMQNYELISIVGSRQCSYYGRKIALELSKYLSDKNITIVSGLAKGIDSYSHIGALKGGGKTIAVLGSGLAQIYPKENIKLALNIIEEGGTIISEYPIDEMPNRLNFPARNRIISGLSNKLIIVEARKNSGSLITVDYALEQGKEIYAVPGNITSNISEGTNELIKDGANIITSYEDVLLD